MTAHTTHSLNPNKRTVDAPAPDALLSNKIPQFQHRGGTAAKATAAVFWGPETFGSGSFGVLPTGWSANSMPTAGGGSWKWMNTASTSTYTMGAMTSSSAADGWMIFDSDSLGAATGGAPSGYLQSPLINCSTQPSVRLNFQNYFRSYYDSCSIWVSTNPSFPSGSYAVYPVFYNNTLPTNEYSPNPTDVHVNISGMAASQPAVYIRFVYYGYTGGSYSWMIDDITLSSMDPVDGALDKASALYWPGSSTGWAAYGVKPSKMQDTVYPVAFASNYGSTPFLSTTVNAKIFQGATSVYDQNKVVVLPVDAMDSVADFTNVGTPAGYYSTTIGGYTIPFSCRSPAMP